MNYKEKYIKYKTKYFNLKNMHGGLYKDNIKSDIFDLDFILPLNDENAKYFFDDEYRFSVESMYKLRLDLQQYYSQIYYFLLNPDTGLNENKNRFELVIPIKNEDAKIDETDLHIGKVKYEIIQNYLSVSSNKYYYILLQIFNNNIYKIKEFSKELKKFITNNTKWKHDFKQSEIDQIDFLYDITSTFIINDKLIDLVNKYNENKLIFSTNLSDSKNIYNTLYIYVIEINNLCTINLKIYNNYDTKKINLLYKLLEINIDKNILTNDIINKFISVIQNETIQNKHLLHTQLSEIQLSGIQLDNINYIELIKNKQKQICDEIMKTFNENPNLKLQILDITLYIIDDNIKEIGGSASHANAILIYKFIKDNKPAYLCLRTEPHRHSNIYCRNSVRKAIRDICKNFPNSYYLDYIIDSKEGLQNNEDIADDIEKRNMYDYYNIPKELRNMSPLQGSSGYCATWTLYVIMILILNKNIDLEIIGKYFADFNSGYKEKGKIKLQRLHEEYDKLCTTQNDECSKIKLEIEKYLNIQKTDTDIIYKNINEKSECDYTYIIMKHIKLYRIILFLLCLLAKEGILDRTKYITKYGGTNIITDKIFNNFDKILDTIKNKLNEKADITIKQNILDKDIHKCDDNLFDHIDFCNINKDISKVIPIPDINNCNNSHLNKDNKIILDSISTNIQRESQTVNEKTKKNVEYLIEKLISHNKI
jgi:hypothetical protein